MASNNPLIPKECDERNSRQWRSGTIAKGILVVMQNCVYTDTSVVHLSIKIIIPENKADYPAPLSLCTASARFFDSSWRETEEPGADALRLLFRMGDPDDGFEGLGVIPDLFQQAVLHRLGRFDVKPGRRFFCFW
jgi:hypothetical protein